MKRVSSRLTYANVISTLALFLVLAGGTAFAAQQMLPKNSVGSKQLKKNSVTAAKIKKGAVTGSKIELKTLGTVPSATNAGHATTADSATKAIEAVTAANATNAVNAVNATNATNFGRYYTSGLKKASVGQTITLGSAGPFTFIGKCEDLGEGEFSAKASVKTSAANSFFWAAEGSQYLEANFEPAVEGQMPYNGGPTSKTPIWYAYNGYYSDFSAASPDGSTLLQGFSNEGVHVFGSDCAFNITWTSNA
jgi:hypothetical protein